MYLVVDVFSDEDLDGEYIDPVETYSVLLKAKPIPQLSSWTSQDYSYNASFFGSQSAAQFPIFRQITSSKINDTLTSFYDVYDNPNGAGDASTFFAEARENLRFINADNDLSNIVVSIKDLTLSCSFSGIVPVTKRLSVIYGSGYNVGEFEFIDLFYSEDDNIFITDQDYEVEIPFLASGGYISVIFSVFDPYTLPTTTPSSSGGVTISNGATMDIELVSTAIDTVTTGVRYIDAIKQTVKSISGLGVVAPKFTLGGKYYDQMLFSGNMIKRRDDVAFSLEFKNLMTSLKEVYAGYQILSDNVYLGQYLDFYPNNEIAFLNSFPDESYTETFNDKFALNTFEFGYKKYEQDDDEENTIDAVHTESQWLLPNKQVENEFKVDLPQIRDPFKIQKTVDEAAQETTSTTSDDEMFLLDVVSLAPNSKGGFTRLLKHNINSDGNLQLLNDNSFNWSILGVDVGGDVTLTNTSNSGTREILEITNNIITLEGGSTDILDGTLTEIEYFYTNVLYVNRTNEGFAEINNLLGDDNFSNLKYTIKENMKNFYNHLSTACKYHSDKTIKNTYFKDNGALETRLDTETELTIQDADIVIADLEEGRLTDRILDLKLVVDYETMLGILTSLNTVNEDGSIGGFIRTLASNGKVVKGYVKEIDYEPASETLTAKLEERNEGNYLNIDSSGGVVTINEVGYDLNTDLEWFEINNGYLKLFDNENQPLINPTYFDKVIVNGVSSNTFQELSEKLINI